MRLVPSTWVAERDGEVLGYCSVQEYSETGYIRNVVTAPGARRSGVAAALMNTTAEHLRARGKRSWRLNVKRANLAARALYEKLGMRTRYGTKVLGLAWAKAEGLPAGDASVRTLGPDRDHLVEDSFGLQRGQLATARTLGRVLFEATGPDGEEPVGMASFDPPLPRAFPFRMKTVAALCPLLEEMRRLAPTDEHVTLVVEDDERLAELLMNAGATVTDDILHMEGSL